MRLRRIFSLISATLAVAAAVGPPATAASGGGGAIAAPTSGGGAGGATYGAAVPKPKPKPKPKGKARRTPQPTQHAARTHGAHAFPIDGAFSWGGADARFDAKRKGHRHQGQDLPAAAGTPVVSPHAGIVEAVDYQRRGAGNYVVIDSDGEDYDFVFMHLLDGSVRVVVGEHLRTGEQIGEVGSTGESSGPHLHFEAWVGGWYIGGHPVDPLPLLRSWAR